MTTNFTSELLSRARSGDEEAYELLFGHLADRLLFYIRGRLGARLRAKLEPEDVLQETYIRAHRLFPRFEGEEGGALRGWLCRIAENCIHDLVKHVDAKKRRSGGIDPRRSRVLAQIAASGTGPLTNVIRRERREQLAMVLETLEEGERRALLYRFFQECTIEEIARALGESPTTTRRILARALERVGRALNSGTES